MHAPRPSLRPSASRSPWYLRRERDLTLYNVASEKRPRTMEFLRFAWIHCFTSTSLLRSHGKGGGGRFMRSHSNQPCVPSVFVLCFVECCCRSKSSLASFSRGEFEREAGVDACCCDRGLFAARTPTRFESTPVSSWEVTPRTSRSWSKSCESSGCGAIFRCILCDRSGGEREVFMGIKRNPTVGSLQPVLSAYPRRHETPNLDWNPEFRNAEFRFSQLLYH